MASCMSHLFVSKEDNIDLMYTLPCMAGTSDGVPITWHKKDLIFLHFIFVPSTYSWSYIYLISLLLVIYYAWCKTNRLYCSTTISSALRSSSPPPINDLKGGLRLVGDACMTTLSTSPTSRAPLRCMRDTTVIGEVA
jgi:hypothetical protein